MGLATKIGGFYMSHITTDKVSEKKIIKSIHLFHSNGVFHNINKLRALFLWDKIQRKYCCNIFPGVTVGDNLHIIHPMGILIGKTTTIGDNCIIYSNAHVVARAIDDDYSSKEKRHATIGNNVILGAKCLIIGKVTIGDDCTIGAGAIVTKDVPARSVVIGINQVREKPEEKIY